MEEPTSITSCLICASQVSPTNEVDDTDTRASISILKKILLQQNEADVKLEKGNSEAIRLFCPGCSEILYEWHEIQDWVSKLLARSKTIKNRLIVNILGSNVTLPEQLQDSAALQELLEDFAAVKRAVINEYRPSLQLQRLAEIPFDALRHCLGNDGQTEEPVDLLDNSTGFEHEDYHDDWEAPTFDAAESIEIHSDDDDDDDESGGMHRKSSLISRHVMTTRKRKRSPIEHCDDSTPKEKHIRETDDTSRRTRPKLRSRTSEVQVLYETLNLKADEAGQTKRSVVTLDNGDILYHGKYTIKLLEKMYLCPVCGEQRPSRYRMIEHIRKFHIHIQADGSKDPEIIGVGENSFLYLNQYGFTVSDHQYKCTTCGIALAKRLCLIDHIQMCHVNGVETSAIETSLPEDTELTPYVQSDTNFDETGQKRRHVVKLDNNHFLYDGKYKIKLCGKKYLCLVCGTHRPSRNGMTEHIRIDHIQAKGPNTSQITSVGENSFLYLDQYGFSISNDQYKCTTCGITFPKRPSLLDHIQVSHVNEADKAIHVDKVDAPQSVDNTEEDPDRHQTGSERKGEQDSDDGEEPVSQDTNKPPSGPRKPFKCVPISKDVFMYAGKYRLALKNGRYKCPKCSCTQKRKGAILQHIRAKHLKSVVPWKVQPLNRIVTISENELMYAGKYRIKIIKNRYFCSECAVSRPSIVSMTAHLRDDHIRKKEVAEATLESEGHNSRSKFFSQLKKIGPNEYIYRGQVRISIKDGVYTCGICGVQMDTLKLMSCHATYKHIRYDNDEFYKSIETLDDGTFKCGKCEYIGTNWKNTYYHIHKHKISLKKTGSAELRKYIYSVEVSPNQFDHGGWPYSFVPETGRYNCGSCSATFPSQPNITRHIGTRHRNPARTVICEECGKAFGSSSLLSSHKNRQHPQPKTVPCPECGKLFVSQEDVTGHQKMHRAEAAKKHVCEFCGRRFLKLNYLQKHRATHTGVAPYSCDACGLGYWTQRDLKAHETTKHPTETASSNVPVDTNTVVVAVDIVDGTTTDVNSM